MSTQKIYDTIIKKEPIQKGWSGDTKYCVTVYDGTKYLMRAMPVGKLEAWQNLFAMLERVAALGVPMSKPVELGTCEDGLYALLSWIDGEDLAAVLPKLKEAEQYELGVKAGEILRLIHSAPAPENLETWCKLGAKADGASSVMHSVPQLEDLKNWSTAYIRKTDDKIKKYKNGEIINFRGGKHFMRYIEQNRESLGALLENRPQCFRHGDYFIHNMMLENGELRIIDFDRLSYGDPWEDFFKVAFYTQICPPFATGQVRGYFDGEPPEDFFKLTAFYISSRLLESITLAAQYGGRKAVKFNKKLCADVLKWHDNMNNPVPSWYLKG